MKKIIISAMVLFMMSCATSSPSTTNTISSGSTTEAAARNLTDRMKSSLGLDATQENKVLMINVINLKVIKKFQETQEQDKILATQTTYQSQMKEVLTDSQFQKFVTEFGNLN